MFLSRFNRPRPQNCRVAPQRNQFSPCYPGSVSTSFAILTSYFFYNNTPAIASLPLSILTLTLSFIIYSYSITHDTNKMEGRPRSRSSTPPTPPPLSPSILPQAVVPEVSMVEAEDVTGVTFTPESVSSTLAAMFIIMIPE